MNNSTVTDFMNFIIKGITEFPYPAELINVDLDLSKTEFIALFLIDRSGECTMSALAEGVSVPMSTATGIVDRLVRHGYVRRGRSEEDRRVVTVSLTEKGLEVIQRYNSRLRGILEKVISSLTAEETEQLMHLLQKIYNVLAEPDPVREAGAASRIRRITVE